MNYKNEPEITIDTFQKAFGLSGISNPREVFDMSYSDLIKMEGIGRKKAEKIMAVREVAQSLYKVNAKEKVNFSSPSSVAQYLMEDMRYLKKEEMRMISLDTKYNVIAESLISIGTVNTSLVSPREVFLEAFQNEAVAMILVHNHPSGCCDFSPNDAAITERLHEASKIVGIELIDHIIIGDGTYCSMKEKGYLN